MEKKTTVVVQSPVSTRSGYGERARDFVRALIELDKYDVKLIPTRWGSTPMNALSETDTDITSRIVTQLTEQPDVFIQITIPNEFNPIGKYNIGVTAGIETDKCSHQFIEGCNRMNLVLASSEHTKWVFENTKYDMMNEQTKQKVGELKLTTPVEVLFEGIDLNIFKKLEASENKLDVLKTIKQDFCYLFVGHWLPGDFNEDRKNVSGLIRTFLEAFKNKTNPPALILKTSMGAPSIMDKTEIEKRISFIKESVQATSLPPIHLVYGDLSAEEMNMLYNHPKVKAHISFTKGEGYGRPLAEAAITGKPILVSNFSGHKDFLPEDMVFYIPGQMTEVHPSSANDWLLQDAKWFSVDHGYAIGLMKDIEKNYKKSLEKSRKTYHHIKTNFSYGKMKEKLDTILTNRLPEFPKEVKLKLPQLKKVGATNTPAEPKKIQLPKLKKIE
jgi:glycosyltransferase involved in cell wall biosynthesis